ncbi:hypothetical protein SPBR_03647 [Sporothrix brasiliensis 5110]|uniref:Uncharacterized protein n=1 Tax=Sporothrix brasiliensis 5110 TaxID=1398154 RepID=A0A0C2F770_9PEZI|nr:uncharacterized protein SPBR_03647 [Sporothrix brasiliensis 5110]KIH94809.1 hypothetical protein SPBR_03647 [Sporothrix brasiliensis 5110]
MHSLRASTMRSQPGRYPASVIDEVQESTDRRLVHPTSVFAPNNHQHRKHQEPLPPSRQPPASEPSKTATTLASAPSTSSQQAQVGFEHLLHSFFTTTTATTATTTTNNALPPERTPRAALVQLQKTAGRILELEKTHAHQASQAQSDPSKPVEAVLPTGQDIAEFLTHFLEASNSILQSSYTNWRKCGRKTEDTGRAKEDESDKETKKRKREDDAGEVPSTNAKRPKAHAETQVDSKTNETKPQHGKSTPDVIVIVDSDSSDDETAIATRPETETGSVQQEPQPQPAMPSRRPVAFPPPPPRNPRWDHLPDAMKLILVKEMTSWYRYRDAVLLLRLTVVQEQAFRALYGGELKKQQQFDRAVRARLDVRDRELFDNRPYTSWDQPTPSHARSLAEEAVGAGVVAGVDASLPRLELLTDYITVQNIKMGEAYLVAAGFDRDWVDLGHWTGHTGTARFEIEMKGVDDGDDGGDTKGHHQRSCGAGSQGTSRLQRQAPEWPGRTRRAEVQQARARAQAHAGAQTQANTLAQASVPLSSRPSTYRRRNRAGANCGGSTSTSTTRGAPIEEPVEPSERPTQKRGRGRPRVRNSVGRPARKQAKADNGTAAEDGVTEDRNVAAGMEGHQTAAFVPLETLQGASTETSVTGCHNGEEDGVHVME